jgi:hypothetical protein
MCEMRTFEDEVRVGNSRALLKAKLDAIMATAATLLVRQQHITAASILTNSHPKFDYLYAQAHHDFGVLVSTSDYWQLNLAIPADIYFPLKTARKSNAPSTVRSTPQRNPFRIRTISIAALLRLSKKTMIGGRKLGNLFPERGSQTKGGFAAIT